MTYPALNTRRCHGNQPHNPPPRCHSHHIHQRGLSSAATSSCIASLTSHSAVYHVVCGVWRHSVLCTTWSVTSLSFVPRDWLDFTSHTSMYHVIGWLWRHWLQCITCDVTFYHVIELLRRHSLYYTYDYISHQESLLILAVFSCGSTVCWYISSDADLMYTVCWFTVSKIFLLLVIYWPLMTSTSDEILIIVWKKKEQLKNVTELWKEKCTDTRRSKIGPTSK